MARTCADDAHAEDGVVRHFGVAVVRELAERVEVLQLRVRRRQQRQRQRHSAFDRRLAVPQLEQPNTLHNSTCNFAHEQQDYVMIHVHVSC